MNYVAEEMRAILNGGKDVLEHYGMPKRSGRYPWGSGDDPYQHGRDFLGRIEELKKTGWQETPENIMNEFKLTTTQYRTQKSLAKDERRSLRVARVKALTEDGLNPTEIGKQMGINESTVRSLMNAESESRMKKAKETADFIRKQIDEKGMIDVGAGVEIELGISKEKLNQALSILQAEGYPVYGNRVPQITNPMQKTTLKVICPPGTEHKEIYDYGNVNSLNEYTSHDNGKTFDKFVYPKSIDSKRIKVLLHDEIGPDGEPGVAKDGIIQLRRGVDDLSLGDARYSQVRILVDDNKFLKGMAVYSDKMPDGVDVVFNSNKKSVEDAYKKIKDDPDNPFGALIKAGGQSYYIDKDGNRQLSAINKRADEGDWTDWKDALPSQFLSKQSTTMAQKQLDIAKAEREAEFDAYCSMNNPTVKKYYLQKFSDECDSAAVHLQAAALPGQKYHVIVPINTLKDNEVYAPNYEDGTKLALIRYPHAGTFEIPVLTVNNKNKDATRILGKDIPDAVGINKSNADRLSGADFDGDTVMCIPTHDRGGKVKITSTPALAGLEGFEPKDKYGYDKKAVDSDGNEHYYREGKEFRVMRNTGNQMGKVSNLICDMTLLGASNDELAAAVRHSMVVIDAEKHKLDYKQSEIDNNIGALRKKYQTGGASTLISRAKGEDSVLKRQGSPKINIKGTDDYDPSKPEGSLIYKIAEDIEYQVPKVNKRTGEVTYTTEYRTQKSKRMAETDDARALISEADTPMERIYADYANSMKGLANKARIELSSTGNLKSNPAAKTAYKKEVDELMSDLAKAELNRPKERQAQLRANAEVAEKEKAYRQATGEKMKPSEKKKISQMALTKYRDEVGSIARKDRAIQITDKKWEAIQAGAISENILKRILNNTDPDSLRARATPSNSKAVSSGTANRIKAMSGSYTIAQIADSLGLSASTVSKYLKGSD